MPNVAHASRAQKKLEKAAYKADKHAEKDKTAALVPQSNVKAGVHNCPVKDAGTTHAFRARCLKLKHAGFCPACGNIRPYMHGCREHEIKEDDLLEKAPSEDAIIEYLRAHGLAIPTSASAESNRNELPKKKKRGKKN